MLRIFVSDPAQLRRAAQLHRLGQNAHATALCQDVLKSDPDNADALHLLGVLRFKAGDLAGAGELIFKAIGRSPNVPDYYNSLGIVLSAQGDDDAALKAFMRAVKLRPNYAEAWKNFASGFERKGNWPEALIAIDKAIEARLDYAEAHDQRGAILSKLDKWKEAAAAHRRAVEIQPGCLPGIEHLVAACELLRDFAGAADACRALVKLKPSVRSFNRLGRLLREAGRYSQALAAHQEALSLDPNRCGTHQNLALVCWRQSRLDQVLIHYRQAVNADPRDAAAHSDLIYGVYHDPASSPPMLLEEGRRWATKFEGKTPKAHANDRNPDRRLRVGYVSPDFRSHTISHVIGPILKAHDRDRVEVFCYSSVQRPDRTTERLKKLCDQWREIFKMPDAEASELIRKDQIDILVELAGHWGGNRLPLFGLKPAPIQMQIAFPGTTGLSNIDYRITDAHSDPPGMTEAFHSEQLIRLPCGWPYEPDAGSPNVAPLPALRNGFITFGSLNRPIKISDQAIGLWKRILDAVPRSKLLVLTEQTGKEAASIVERFARHGIGLDRLEPLARLPQARYRQQFSRIDIALDTFPYNGETTTCDGLWMGVPIVTLAGSYSHSRRGVSHLTNLGLADLIAHSTDEYVNIAASLASDPPRLAELRRSLRHRMARSCITDGIGYTRALEAAYREAWQRWRISSMSC